MRLRFSSFRSLMAMPLVIAASSANADWGVAEGSSVSYISIKNQAIAETNRFTNVTGSITDDGQVSIRVDLASVETRVDIRNQRMRDLFFEVATHPEAIIGAQLTPMDLAQLDSGAPVEREMKLEVSLHGSTASVTANIRALAAGGQLYVSTLEPIIVSAADFGLEGGVEMLRELAGLNAIASAIPVSVDLKLVAD